MSPLQPKLGCIIIIYFGGREKGVVTDRVSGYIVRTWFTSDYIHVLIPTLEVVLVWFRAKILLEAVWHSG